VGVIYTFRLFREREVSQEQSLRKKVNHLGEIEIGAGRKREIEGAH